MRTFLAAAFLTALILLYISGALPAAVGGVADGLRALGIDINW